MEAGRDVRRGRTQGPQPGRQPARLRRIGDLHLVPRGTGGDVIPEDRSTDAYSRARLAFSALLGLAVSRYKLRQEPLAGADHETLAAWVAPCIDHFLHGRLGEAMPSAVEAGRDARVGRVAPAAPVAAIRPVDV